MAAYWPQVNISGKRTSPASDANHSPLGSPSAAESHESRVLGPLAGPLFVVVSKRPMKDAMRALASLDGQEPPAVREVGGGPPHRRRQVVRSLAATGVLRAERRVATELLVGRPPVPDVVAGRVHREHHRTVDALRV